VCNAVSHIHSFSIIHRDLKAENVLLVPVGGGSLIYKLCDFGSSTSSIIQPGTSLGLTEIRALEEEIGKFTTKEYRAPELCDLYQRMGITEKIDMWALGVFLYKLCYFVTPFEESGQLAIINAKYSIPEFPKYSAHLIKLIGCLLSHDPSKRPRIDDVVHIIVSMLKVSSAFNPTPFVELDESILRFRKGEFLRNHS